MNARLKQTSAVRTAATFALVFLVGSAMLLGSIFFITNRAIDAEADAVILAEQEGLLEDYGRGGSAAVAAGLMRRMDSWGRNGALYLLVDPSHRRIAGNLSQWPFDTMPAEDWPEFSVLARHAGGQVHHAVRARLHRLPDGNVLLIGTDLSERQAFARKFGIATFWGVCLVALLAAAAGAWLSRSVMRRVAAVADACQSILDGDLSMRLPVAGTHDEFDMLSIAVNQVLARLEEQTRTLTTTLDSVAHDLRGPLHRLRTRLEELGRPGISVPAVTSTLLDRSLRDIDHIQRTLGTLLQIARTRAREGMTHTEAVDLSTLTSDVGELFEPVAQERGMTLAVHNEAGAVVAGHRQLLAQLLANLVENSLSYARPGGHIEIAARCSQDSVLLSVADDGPGIPPADRQRVLQPFVRLRTDAAVQGAGLGLSLVAAVASMHRATLVLEDNQPGLRVAVVFAPPGAGTLTS